MPTKLKNMLRARAAYGVAGEVNPTEKHDNGEGVIRGVAIMTEGNALDISGDYRADNFDRVTLEQVRDLGNDKKDGLKMRFGHPNMSNTALGTFLARGKNLRIDENGDGPLIVRADMFLDKTSYDTPNGDLGGYVLRLAKSDPGAFGTSIVYDGKDVALDADGNEIEEGLTREEWMQKFDHYALRVTRLYAADAVDDPAANYEFFENTPYGKSKSNKLAFLATKFLDSIESAGAVELLQRFIASEDAAGGALDFMRRYMENKTSSSKPISQEADMPDKKEGQEPDEVEVVEDATDEAPDAVADPNLNGEAAPDESEGSDDKAAEEEVEIVDVAAELSAERDRCVGIVKLANSYGFGDIAAELIECDASIDEAEKTLKARKLSVLGSADGAKPAGPNPEEKAVASFDVKDPDTWEDAWKKDEALRRRYGRDKNNFFAFNRASAKGLIRLKKS